MELLRADHLYFWRQGHELLKDVSLTLRQGERVGLVGRNGAGKTTLLKILSGELTASDGKVFRSPGLRLSHLSQSLKFSDETIWEIAKTALEDVHALEQKLREEETRIAQGAALDDYRKLTEQFETLGGYKAEVMLEKILTLFGFTDTSQNVQTLSGGEQMRLALVMALVRQPDVLLLDEPTNHLDLTTKRLLASQLKNYSGAILLASHDRAFLDMVCTHTALLRDATLVLYKGNYTRMQAQRSLESQSLQKRVKETKKETERLQKNQDQSRQWGRNGKRQAFPEIPLLETEARSSTLTITPEVPKETLLTAKHLSKKVDEKILLEDVSLRLEAGDKVALLGANGTGKSTLLKMLAGELESDNPNVDIYFHDNSKVFVYDQARKAVADNVVMLEQLATFVSNERAKMLLALVGLPQQQWLAYPDTLSGGERSRLGLAKLIASEANILLLDEPTNDLDIQLIERLEDALSSSNSATIFVTHDERFVENVATRIWSLEHGKITEYQGGISGYFKKQQKIEELKVESNESKVEESYEEKLERLELEKLELEEILLDSVTNSERDYARAKLRYADVANELSVLYDKPFPEPLPRYQVAERDVEVNANIIDGQIELATNANVTLKIKCQDNIAHLGIIEGEESCLLPWTRVALLNCLTHLSFLYFDAKVVQYQFEGDVSASGLKDTGLKDAGNGWWVRERSSFEEEEGYVRKSRTSVMNKKRRKHLFKRKLKKIE